MGGSIYFNGTFFKYEHIFMNYKICDTKDLHPKTSFMTRKLEM